MVTLNFRIFSEMTVQDGFIPISKARLDVINPMAEQQRPKGLIAIPTESGEIIWVHPYIVQDERWETSKSKPKDKSCNTSLSQQITTL